jgi:hypothetical protein
MSKHVRLSVLLATLGLLAALRAARADELCATSGLDTPPPGGGVVNTYYPGTAAGQLLPGTISIPVGPPVGAQAIVAGDLLFIIQMQDATINFQNDDRYGDATQGDNLGRGMLDPREAGKFEYVVATGAVAGGFVPIKGEGPDLDGGGPGNPGTINTYTNADATATEGQRRYQVIRVPRYASLNMPGLGASITAGYWNGSTGGILVFQVAGTLTLSSTRLLSATGRGFRGGSGQRVGDNGNVIGATALDYRTPSISGAETGSHGNKGEGIAGTPRYVRNSFSGFELDTGVEGYPAGSRARGAPANAGGGGTDSAPVTNNNSAGGGGGGNGGPGGGGGNTSDDQPLGGHGGAAFLVPLIGTPLWGPGRLVMGGGGGSGTKDDNSPSESFGGSGGGIVLIHAGSFAGTGIIESNGVGSPNLGSNDGGGGAGAGGSVLIISKSQDFSAATLTVNANGGKGENAGSGTSVLGPGGGGGGGVVLMTPVTTGSVTVTTTPGASGTTGSGSDPHGSTPGTVGTLPPGDPSNPYVDPATLVPGADSAADCDNNGAPVNTVPGPQGTLIDTPLVFSPANGNMISTVDPDSDPLDIVVTISVTSGILTVDGTAVGLTSVSGDGTNSVVLTGTWAEINDALNPLTYTPAAAFTGLATLTILADDQGNIGLGAVQTDTDNVTINVGNQNLPPALTVPGATQTTPEDTPRVFSLDLSNRVSVSDPDSDPNPIQVTITVDDGNPATLNDGVITLADISNLATVTGDGTGSVTMTGTMSALEAALGRDLAGSPGFSYTPAPNFVGSVTITIVVDDLGWSLAGAQVTPLTDTGTITVDVTAVNDAPVAVDDAYTVVNTDVLNATLSGVLLNDSDVEGQTLTAVLVSPPATGLLVLNSDGTFTYDPPDDFLGTVTFTYQANDGTNDSNVATVTISVVLNTRIGRQRAGYCGLTGLEVFAILAALRFRRRPARNR